MSWLLLGNRAVVEFSATAVTSLPSIVLLPGLGEGPLSLGPLAHELNQHTGRHVMLVKSPRWGRTRVEMPDGYPPALNRLAGNIAVQMLRRNVRGATGIFHSLGGITGLIATELDPGLFSEVIILCGAGQLPQDSLARLMPAVALKSWHCLRDGILQINQPIGRANLISLLESAGYIAANPRRSLEEGQAAAEFNSGSLIQRLRQRGIKIYCVLARNDVVFDHLQAREELSYLGAESVFVVDGPHDLQLDPRRLVDMLVAHGLI